MGEVSAATGDLAKARVYDVFGTVRAEDTATSQSVHKFVGALGHPSEGETGLIYMRARFMDAETGRFVSEDPAGQGMNWFIYCGSNPVDRTDISGKWWKPPLPFPYDFIIPDLAIIIVDAAALVFPALAPVAIILTIIAAVYTIYCFAYELWGDEGAAAKGKKAMSPETRDNDRAYHLSDPE